MDCALTANNMTTLLYIILGTTIVSLGSLVGVVTLGMNQKFLDRILLGMIGLSSGALLGVAFIHMIPEGIKLMDPEKFCLIILITIIVYLIVEKLLHWHHCHTCGNDHKHTLGYMNLVGDSVHNFIDGLVIASAFIVSPALGLSTIVAIAMHEIPQEIGDFGVLLYSGFTKRRAIFFNLMVSATAILGGIVGWAVSSRTDQLNLYLIPIAVGGFIYIALSDIVPELRKEDSIKNFFGGLILLVGGIIMMFFLRD